MIRMPDGMRKPACRNISAGGKEVTGGDGGRLDGLRNGGTTLSVPFLRSV